MISRKPPPAEAARPPPPESNIEDVLDPPWLMWYPAMGFEGLHRTTRAGRPVTQPNVSSDPYAADFGMAEEAGPASAAAFLPTHDHLRAKLESSSARRRVPARAIYSATSGEQSAWAATLEESVRGSQWAAERELSPPRSIVASHAAARGDGWPERSELRMTAAERRAKYKFQEDQAREAILGTRTDRKMGALDRVDLVRMPHAVQHTMSKLPKLPGQDEPDKSIPRRRPRNHGIHDDPNAMWERSLRYNKYDHKRDSFKNAMQPTQLNMWLSRTESTKSLRPGDAEASVSSYAPPHRPPPLHLPSEASVAASEYNDGLVSPKAKVHIDELGFGFTMRPEGGWAKELLHHALPLPLQPSLYGPGSTPGGPYRPRHSMMEDKRRPETVGAMDHRQHSQNLGYNQPRTMSSQSMRTPSQRNSTHLSEKYPPSTTTGPTTPAGQRTKAASQSYSGPAGSPYSAIQRLYDDAERARPQTRDDASIGMKTVLGRKPQLSVMVEDEQNVDPQLPAPAPQRPAHYPYPPHHHIPPQMRGVVRVALAAERLKATAMRYNPAVKDSSLAQWDLLQEESRDPLLMDQPSAASKLSEDEVHMTVELTPTPQSGQAAFTPSGPPAKTDVAPIAEEPSTNSAAEPTPGEEEMMITTSAAAREGWKKVRVAVEAAQAAGFAKKASNFMRANLSDPDLSQVRVMWAEYEHPEEYDCNMLSKGEGRAMAVRKRAVTAPGGKMPKPGDQQRRPKAGDEAIQTNFRGLRRTRITALVGGRKPDPAFPEEEEYRMALVKNMDVQIVIDRLLALQDARRIAGAVVGMDTELSAVLLATIANMGLVTRPHLQWSKAQQPAKNLRRLPSDKDGLALVAEVLGRNQMPPTCAGKILIHMEPELAATLLDLIPAAEREEIDASIEAGPEVMAAATDVFMHIHHMDVDRIVAGLHRLLPVLTSAVLDLIISDWEALEVKEVMTKFITADVARAAEAFILMNPKELANLLSLMDEDRFLWVPTVLNAMEAERATSVLEQLPVFARALCLQTMETAQAVRCLMDMEFRRAAEACTSMNSLATCSALVAAAEEGPMVRVMEEMCVQSTPPGKRTADVLGGLTAQQAAVLMLLMRADARQLLLREMEIGVLVSVVQQWENDQAAEVTCVMDTKKLVLLMAKLPATRAAAVLEQMKQETIAQVVMQMPKEISSQVLQRMGASKAAAPFEVLTPTEAAAILGMMTVAKAYTIISCMNYVRASALLVLMRVDHAAPVVDLLSSDMAANVLHEILPQKAAGLMNKMQAQQGAVVLARMDRHKAVQMLHGMDQYPAAAMVEVMETPIAGKLLNKLEDMKTAVILEEVNPLKAGQIADRLDPQHAVSVAGQMSAERLALMIGRMESTRKSAWLLENVAPGLATAVVQFLETSKAAQVLSLIRAERAGIVMEKVEPKIRAEVTAEVDAAQAGAVLDCMDAANASNVLSRVPIEHAAAVIGSMNPQAAVEVLANLDILKTAEMLSLAPETATVKVLNIMEAETAGTVMACMEADKGASLQAGMTTQNAAQAAEVLAVVAGVSEDLAVEILSQVDEVSGSKLLMEMSPDVAGMLSQKIDDESMSARFQHMTYERVATVIVEMEPEKAWAVLQHLADDVVGHVLKIGLAEYAASLMEFMSDEKGLKVFSLLEAKDSADILQHAEGEHGARILEAMQDALVMSVLSQMHGNRAARLMDFLSTSKVVAVLLLMSAVRGAEYLGLMKVETGTQVIVLMPNQRTSQLLNNMPVNKAGALVASMDPEPRATLLKFLGPEPAQRFLKAGAGRTVAPKKPLNAPAAASKPDALAEDSES